MIYMETDGGQKVLIIEPGNMRHLREGGVVVSPDKKIALMFSPDTTWLGSQIGAAAAAKELTEKKLSSLHKESLERQPVIERPSHPPVQIIKDGQAIKES